MRGGTADQMLHIHYTLEYKFYPGLRLALHYTHWFIGKHFLICSLMAVWTLIFLLGARLPLSTAWLFWPSPPARPVNDYRSCHIPSGYYSVEGQGAYWGVAENQSLQLSPWARSVWRFHQKANKAYTIKRVDQRRRPDARPDGCGSGGYSGQTGISDILVPAASPIGSR